MRGEKESLGEPGRLAIGSSPHARGKASAMSRVGWMNRIIPACAGKSADLYDLRFESQDHPRMRGEKCISATSLQNLSGSSPHARGKVNRFRSRITCNRIIPACAGKSQIVAGEWNDM